MIKKEMDQKRKDGLKTLKKALQGIVGNDSITAREKLKKLYDESEMMGLIQELI